MQEPRHGNIILRSRFKRHICPGNITVTVIRGGAVTRRRGEAKGIREAGAGGRERAKAVRIRGRGRFGR
eukprot:scaffold4009_cov101-Isochrysis_galbana.AAC.8